MFSPPKEKEKRKPQTWVTVWLEAYKGDVTHVRLPTTLEDLISHARSSMKDCRAEPLHVFAIDGKRITDGNQLKKGVEYIVLRTDDFQSHALVQSPTHIKSPKRSLTLNTQLPCQPSSKFLSPTKKAMAENKIQTIKDIVVQDMLEDDFDQDIDVSPLKPQESSCSPSNSLGQNSLEISTEEFSVVRNPALNEDGKTENHEVKRYENTWDSQYQNLEETQDETIHKQLTQVSGINESSSARTLSESQHRQSQLSQFSGMDTIRSKHMDIHSKHGPPFWEQIRRLGPSLFQTLRNIPESQIDNSVLRELVQEFKLRESAAKINWFRQLEQELRDQYICPDVSGYDILFAEDIRKTLNNTLFSFERNGLLNEMCPRCIISGPTGSGKTTVMYLLTKLLAQKFDKAGKWTEIFIFPVNWKKMLYTDSLDNFYLKFMKHLLSCLCDQREALRPFNSLLHRFFAKLLKQKWLPSLGSKKFEAIFETAAQAIRNIARRILAAWHKNATHEFLTLVFSLPVFLGEVFGFSRSLLVYDHLDKADVKLLPANLSTTTAKYSLFHAIKLSLQHSHSIVSGNIDRLEYILRESKASPIDIRDKFVTIHTVGMVSDSSFETVLPPELIVENIIDLQGIVEQHFIKLEDLKACPGYLALFHKAYKQHVSSPFFEHDASQGPLVIKARNLSINPEELEEYSDILANSWAHTALKPSLLGSGQ